MIKWASSCIVLVLSAFLFVQATGVDKSYETPRMTTYVFTGSNLNDATDPELWEPLDEVPANCGIGTQLPCHVETTGSIESWLAGKTPHDVRHQANSKRN